MTRIELKSKIDADGILNVSIPLGKADANREVRITVEPLDGESAPVMSEKEWKDFVTETAGSITDSTFCRNKQGEFEKREDLFP